MSTLTDRAEEPAPSSHLTAGLDEPEETSDDEA
jgi:hypothetical protein